MRKSSTGAVLWNTCIAIAIIFAFAGGASAQKSDTSILKINRTANPKNSYLKNGLRILLPPLKPASSAAATKNTAARVNDKVLDNVQIFPNPVTDIISVKYTLNRSTNVSIKIVDVLGNDMVTLFSQRVEPGEQKFSYNLGNNINSGFYFVRVVAGTESVIKRISILSH